MTSHELQAPLCARQLMAPAVGTVRWLLAAGLLLLGAQAAAAADYECKGGAELPSFSANDLRDLKVTGTCRVRIGVKSYFANVNILDGGILLFRESEGPARSRTDFWASSIIIENRGAMVADGGQKSAAYGLNGGTLTIHLYGKNEAQWDAALQKFTTQNVGAICKSGPNNRFNKPQGPCGVDLDIWNSNGSAPVKLPIDDDKNVPITDYFYQYGPLRGDERCTDGSIFTNGKCASPAAKVGYFGSKVLAVSFGGALNLNGFKGSADEGSKADNDPTYSGMSWMRLDDGTHLPNDMSPPNSPELLFLERDPGAKWQEGDEIVVTSTDYLPSHSEKLRIVNYKGGQIVPFHAVESSTGKIQWRHNAVRYGGPADAAAKRWTARLPGRIKDNLDADLVANGAETRAAVALLTRSIQIVSAGDKVDEDFRPESTHYSYGAHMVVRQGAYSVQIQGVEFRQMGQGGRLAHYPVHFHMARKTAGNTYIKDSSINESMTRWIVIHSTQGVTLARNVGYKSMGHGFYLEDGTETDNKFYSNIGIYARAAVKSVKQNPRMIPGILADNQDPKSFTDKNSKNIANPGFPYRSDVENPTVFWIANGWNDFIGNMAVGAGACGAAYWFVPASNSDMVETSTTHTPMKWSGYAALQGKPGYGGTTPLKSFYKNYASSTMHSFQTTDDAPPCDGIRAADAPPHPNYITLQAVSSDAPLPIRKEVKDKDGTHTAPDNDKDHFYPHVIGSARRVTHCADAPGGGFDCEKVLPCAEGAQASENCGAVVLDHYTSSFHWAHGNISAIWLRPQWYLLTNSVLTDVQNGGITFVTGGDYTHASIIGGYWALAHNSIFVGNTQPNPAHSDPDWFQKLFGWTSNVGPFNWATKAWCDKSPSGVPPYCLNADEAISMPVGGFFTNQRLANIYDGPSYQESNAYLDITPADCPVMGDAAPGCMYGTGVPLLLLRKVPGGTDPHQCYLPNAAIGWKQPNGFFYPPAFHVNNLFFDNAPLRHYVIAPLFQAPEHVTGAQDFGQGGTYLTNADETKRQYCTGNTQIFNNWTSIDRQTELNDDDGSLTGLSNDSKDPVLKQTISINEDRFFSAPLETAECASSVGANATPAKACTPDAKDAPVTARTSPFDYVATALYHKSADGYKTDLWHPDCAAETCYGVPLFRQLLTGDKAKRTGEWKYWYANKCDADPKTPQCRWPFIRMAGSAISQRETLTINNGAYYLDTTVSAKAQETEKYANVADSAKKLSAFKGGQTYSMFFLYAKKSTKQTYRIYVGKKFGSGDFKPGRMNIDTGDLDFHVIDTKVEWVTPDTSQVATTGILKVTLDFSKAADKLAPTAANGLCRPHKFCKPDGDKCVSALEPGNPLIAANARFKAQNDKVCQNWAVKDLDCPADGCLGFSFTLPSNFEEDGGYQYHRPDPESFPAGDDSQGKPNWSTKFTGSPLAPDDKSGGQCYYNPQNQPVKEACSP
jgi:hypothetical protein